MSDYLGRYWLPRVMLIALALVLSLKVWPWAEQRLARRSMGSFGAHLVSDSKEVVDVDFRLQFAPPVLFNTSSGDIRAWDWRTNEEWRVTRIPPDTTVVPVGGGRSIAFIDGDRLTVVDIQRPCRARRYDVPFERLVLVTRDERFCVTAGLVLSAWPPLTITDLRTGDSVRENSRFYSPIGLSETDEIELGGEPWHDSNNDDDFEYARYKIDGDGNTVPSSPRPKIESPVQLTRTSHGDVVAYSADRQFAAAYVFPNPISLYRVDRAEPLRRFHVPSPLRSLVFSRDGRQLVTLDKEGDLRVIETTTGARIAENRRSRNAAPLLFWTAVASGVGVVLAGCLLTREEPLRFALCDFLLACLFGCSLLYTLPGDIAPMAAGAMLFSLALLTGIYLANSECRPLGRWLHVGVAFAVIAAGLKMRETWLATLASGASRYESTEWLLGAYGFVAISAAVSSWCFTFVNLSIGRQDVAVSGSRYQFNLATLFTMTGMLAALLASAQAMYVDSRTVASVIGQFGCWFPGLFPLTLLTIGCGMIVWERRSTWYVATLLLAPFLPTLLCMVLRISPTSFEGGPLWAISLVIAMLVFPLELAFLLIVRSGYRWVRVDQPPPNSVANAK